jgi:peptidylprolyl isomerase
MKSRPNRNEHLQRALRIAACVGMMDLVAACGGGGSGGATPAPSPAATPVATNLPQPTASDVERVAFDPALGVRLDKMSKRASGLYVQDLTVGTGAVALRGKTAVVRYTGWMSNGTQFDSGEVSVTLGSNHTIAAWEEGLLGMRVGGKRRLVVPPNLGYGERGSGTRIPPNSVLVFDMEVTEIL